METMNNLIISPLTKDERNQLRMRLKVIAGEYD